MNFALKPSLKKQTVFYSLPFELGLPCIVHMWTLPDNKQKSTVTKSNCRICRHPNSTVGNAKCRIHAYTPPPPHLQMGSICRKNEKSMADPTLQLHSDAFLARVVVGWCAKEQATRNQRQLTKWECRKAPGGYNSCTSVRMQIKLPIRGSTTIWGTEICSICYLCRTCISIF